MTASQESPNTAHCHKHHSTNMILLRGIAFTCNLMLSMLAIAGLAIAQRAERGILSNEEAWPVGVATVATWGLHDDGELTVVNLSSMTSAHANCGVHLPGGMFVISETEVLVCGRDNLGVGLLEHWHFDLTSEALQRQSSYSSSTMDFAGVVYDETNGQLYLLDCANARIVKGAWSRAAPLAGVALTSLVDSTTLPFLAESQSLLLVPNRAGSSRTMNLVRWPMHRGVAFAEIVDGASLSIRYGIDDWLAPKVSLNEPTVTEGSSSVEVWAPPGTNVEVLKVGSAAVLGSGTIGAGGISSVALTQSLSIGARYMARVAGEAVHASSACVCRHGFPETFASGAALDGFYYQLGAEIGQSFTVEVGVSAGPQSSAAVYEGMLLIGLRIGGVDPLVPYGNNWLLNTSVYVPAQGFMTSAGWGMIAGEIAIPNDPGLVGLVFLTQFVMGDGQDYVLSEVYGSVIEATPVATATAQSATLPNPFAAAFAAQHMQAGLLSGKVFDATPRLLQVLMRR